MSILNPIDQEADSWEALRCSAVGGTVRFSRLIYQNNGDRFTKLRAGTMAFFERRTKESPEGVSIITNHLENTECILGVVAEPSFDEINKLSELIHFLAIEFNAIIFNGESMLDMNGNTLA